MLANAFIAKAVLGMTTTAGLIERLSVDRALRRICGFPMWKKLPDESTFSRAFAEFAADGLAERRHAALIRETLGNELIGHISRDGTAIEAREETGPEGRSTCIRHTEEARSSLPRRNSQAPGKVEQQQGKPLAQLLMELPPRL